MKCFDWLHDPEYPTPKPPENGEDVLEAFQRQFAELERVHQIHLRNIETRLRILIALVFLCVGVDLFASFSHLFMAWVHR